MNNRILIFIEWYRPGYKAGGPVTSVSNMVNQLAGKYKFFILTRNSDYGETIPYKEVEADKLQTVSTDPFGGFSSGAGDT